MRGSLHDFDVQDLVQAWLTLVQTWATCIITGPGLACDDTKAFFNEGKLCLSPGEERRQTASLYYAYAVDTLTNLMGMF